jgi:DNA polymerase III subunit epsilon
VLQAHKPTPHTDAELEAMAEALAASGQYRIQRRIRPRPKLDAPAGTELKQALFVDVETTGLDHQTDEIIELAIVPFTYGADGQIYEVKEPFQRFNQPSKPISAEITRLTGITDEMVAGHALDATEVVAFVQDAVLVIAHNAGFDRRFMEKLTPAFALKGWACSQSQIDWAEEGIEGTRLSYLVAGAGYFYDTHRAANDCLAAIELLASPLPISGATGLTKLLQNARMPTWRIWAENSPFDLKDVLKARGYRWNPDGTPFPKAWFIDVPDDNRQAELNFLQQEIYQREIQLLTRKIDAFTRFSDRI